MSLILFILSFSLHGFTNLNAEIHPASSINISAQIANRYDKVYKYIPSGRLYLTDHFKTVFDLDLNSTPTEDLKLFSRLTATKYWNQWYTQNQPNHGQFNFNIDDKFRSDGIHLSLAYLEYKPLNWFTFLGGRLPTVDGTPAHYYRGNKSEALLPKLAFGAEVDGALMYGHYNQFSVYIGYLPYLLQNYAYQTTSINLKPLVNNSQTEAETLAPRAAIGLTADFEDVQLKALIHHSWTNYLRFPDTTLDASFFDSSLSGNSQLTSSLFTSHRNLLFHLEKYNLAQLKLNLSVSYMFTTLQSNGTVSVSSGVGSGRNLGGYGTASNDKTFNGGIFLLAVQYTTPFKNFKEPQIGIEYLSSTPDAFYYDRNPDDPSQFYATRGQGYHLYLNQPLNASLNIRAGYRLQYFSTTAWMIGESQPNSTKIDTYYADVKATF